MCSGEKIIFVAILVKDKEYCLQKWLKNLLDQDYPKKNMILYIKANNSTDNTVPMMKQFVKDYREEYRQIFEDYNDDDFNFEGVEEHDWTKSNRRLLIAQLREQTFKKCLSLPDVDFFFTFDVDNFIKPFTLSNLVSHNKDFVAPLVGCTANPQWYNFFFKCAGDGLRNPHSHPEAMQIMNRTYRGLIEVDLIHCVYLISIEALKKLTYIDGTDTYEFVILSRSARKAGIKQYIDSTHYYGTIIMDPNEAKVIEQVMEKLQD